MEYKAIVKRKTDDELQHHKYIKRVKGGNGKYRYYYDTKRLKNDVKDKLGYDERAAKDKAISTLENTLNHPEATYKEIEWRDKQAKEAIKAYAKTPMGAVYMAKQHVTHGLKVIDSLFKRKLNIK